MLDIQSSWQIQDSARVGDRVLIGGGIFIVPPVKAQGWGNNLFPSPVFALFHIVFRIIGLGICSAGLRQEVPVYSAGYPASGDIN